MSIGRDEVLHVARLAELAVRDEDLDRLVAQMNRIAIFAGVLFWSWLWGVPGMLLAIPMMVVLKAVCDRVEELRPIGNMLGE